MKLSILTATYNRGALLVNIYKSIYNNVINLDNMNFNVEWIIIDDGSTDNTKDIVEEYISKKNNIEIKYLYQENSGKMHAINNGMRYVTGDICVDCDSDDFFSDDAFKNIYNNVNKLDLLSEKNKNIYGICFLKKDLNGNISGKKFNKEFNKTTMFDLYFKEDIQGEKIIVFNAEIRKNFEHQLERK